LTPLKHLKSEELLLKEDVVQQSLAGGGLQFMDFSELPISARCHFILLPPRWR